MQRMPWDDPQSFMPEEEPLAPASRASPVIDNGDLGQQLTALRSGQQEREQIDLSPDGVLRRAQEASIQQHNEYAQHLQQRQSQVNLQGADLELATRMAQITAPGIPKSAREYLLNREAARMGVDYKGDSFKDFKRMLHGLDPDSLAALRSSFVTGAVETPPGALVEMTRSVFRGQADGVQLLGMIRASQPSGERPPGMMRLGVPPPPEETSIVEPVQATTETAPAAETLAPASGDPRTPRPLDRQLPPALSSALGLDPSVPRNMGDAVARGYSGPTDEAGITKFLHGDGTTPGRLPADQSGFNSLNSLARINELVDQHGTAILRIGGTFNTPIGPLTVPLSSEVRRAFERKVGPVYGRTSETDPPLSAPADPAAPTPPAGEPNSAGRFAAPQLNPPPTRDTGFVRSTIAEDEARNNAAAQLDTATNDFVYNLGRLYQQAGRSFTEQDAVRMQSIIGSGTSPAARQAAMSELSGIVWNTMLQGRQGVPLSARDVPQENRDRITNSAITPDGARRFLVDQQAASSPPTAAPVQSATPGITVDTSAPAPAAAAPAAAAANAPGTIPRIPAIPGAAEMPPVPVPAPLRRGATSEERKIWRDDQRAYEMRQNAVNTMQTQHNAEYRLQEAFERGTPFQRQEIARREMQRAQDKFQAAMQKVASIAAGIRGSGGGGGSISGASGGDQDVAAFRITPAPQRSLPTPAPASGGMGGIPALSAQGPVGAAMFSFPARGVGGRTASAPAGRISGGAASEELEPFKSRKRRKRRA